MKVIKDDDRYILYSDNLIVMDKLPNKTFKVGFHKQIGFYLYEVDNIQVKEKIYGCPPQKVDKIMKSFKLFQRNLGVILSGDKGIGKSICAKLISERATKEGYPVILINEPFVGVSGFISSISQECVVIFDEFDKVFSSNRNSLRDNGGDDSVNQEEFLTLFDGFDQGKKLFVITCNDIRGLNDFLVNRPGRFHYHLRFEYPTSKEVEEYLTDNLDPKYYNEIPNVIAFSGKFNLNYDTLRAIAFELNTGETLSDAAKDLNIIKEDRGSNYSGTIYLSTGEEVKFKNIKMDNFSSDVFDLYVDNVVIDGNPHQCMSVYFSPENIIYLPSTGEEVLSGQDVEKVEYYFNEDDDTRQNFYINNVTVSKIIFRRKKNQDIHYVL